MMNQKVYHAVIAQVADDAAFTQNVRTLFSNDQKNLDKLGAGTSREYFETNEGKLIEGNGTVARYMLALFRRQHGQPVERIHGDRSPWPGAEVTATPVNRICASGDPCRRRAGGPWS